MMIDAEMYGMMPNANRLNLDSAPPENILNIPRIPSDWDSNSFANTSGSIPGTGMNVPKRKTISAPITNKIRLFSSVILPTEPNKLSLANLSVPSGLTRQSYRQQLQLLHAHPCSVTILAH